MKKHILFTLIIFLTIAVVFVPRAQAGKPKPTTYPAPEFEIQAYPDPIITEVPTPEPTIEDQLYSQNPTADPRPGIPYFWGRFAISINRMRVMAFWVSLSGVGNQSNLSDGVLCISTFIDIVTKCDELHFYSYSPQSDINLYYTRMSYCDISYFVSLVWLYGMGADYGVPRTDEYFEKCIYLPSILRG